MADQDEFLDINGTKVYKSLFAKNPEGWNKLVQAQSGSSEQDEAWQQKQAKEEQEEKQQEQAEDEADTARLAKAGITLGPKVQQSEQGQPSQATATINAADQDAAKKEEAITAASTPTSIPTQPPQPPVVQALTPAMIQETAITKVMQSPEAKQAVKTYQDATQASIDANAAKAQFEITRANALNAARLKEAQQQAIDTAETKKTNDEFFQEMKTRQDQMNTTVQELSNYQFKDFFQGREGARAMAGLSMALGAVGSAFAGTPNYAMEIVQNAIQNDLALQKANYEKLRGSLEGQKMLYGQLVERFKDKSIADQAFYKLRLDQMAKQADAMASNITNDEAKARIGAMKAQFQQEGAKAVMAATEGLKTQVQTTLRQAAPLSIKDAAEISNMYEKKWNENEVGDAKRANNAAEKFRDIVKSGAGETAIADFIASKGGLETHRMTDQFMNMINTTDLKDKAYYEIQKMFKGGANPQLVNKIQNFLDVNATNTAENAAARLPEMIQEFRTVGKDPEPWIRQINEKGLQRYRMGRAGAVRLK